MTWHKTSDTFADHPKVLSVSLAARGLWITVAAYCSRHLTDGEVPKAAVWMHAAGEDPTPLAQELVDAGLWEPTERGWAFHDWLDYNPSREKVDRDRARNAERQERFRERRRNGVTDGVSDVSRNPRPDPTRPEISLSRLAAGPSDDTCGALTAWLEVALGDDLSPEEGMTASEMWGKGEPHGFVLNTIRKQRRTGRTA